jgi:hypothetical protein
MSMEADFEYVQTRLQARLALLPDEATWLRLGAVRGLAPYLEAVRGSSLGVWANVLAADTGAAAIDQTCRRLLLESIAQAARWVPAPWADAVRWLRWTVCLPELDVWLRGGAAPRGGEEAAFLATGLAAGQGGRACDLAGEAAVLGEAFRAGQPLAGAWTHAWRRRWPACAAETRESLESLLDLLRRHGQRFPGLALREAWPARRALRQAVRHLFRRAAQSPAAVCAYLLMLALDLERLRADLTRRVLFGAREAG